MLYFSKFSRGCMRAVITSLCLYIKRSFFVLNFIKICIKMLVTCLKIFSGSLIPYIIYSNRAGKIIRFYIKMTIFGIILRNI